MLLFRKILNFKKNSVDEHEKRRAQRHAVGRDFALKSTILTIGRDPDGQLLASKDGKGRDWGCRVVNLSSNGANLRLPLALLVKRDDPCVLKLSLDRYALEVPGRVAHFRINRDSASCGVALDFGEFTTQKAYLQLLEPVAIGSSLAPVPAKNVKQDSPNFVKEQYAGPGNELLTIWRPTAEGPPTAFELRLPSHFIRGSVGQPLMVYGHEDARDHKGYSAPVLNPTALHAQEVQRLYSWIVPNLGSEVPDDVKALLAKFVA